MSTSTDEKIGDLLRRWLELQEHGEDVSAEDLCADCPQLLAKFRQRVCGAMQSMERLIGPSSDASETATDAAGPVQPPSIAGYEIIGKLGHGGMGVVYKARQLRPHRFVAIKMILAGAHASPVHLARFQTEAEAVARLQHPNIMQIYEVGEQNGLPYFTMELLEGGSLAQRIAGRPVTFRQAAELIETLARAIHQAHVGGIVHRDLKPANVLFARVEGEGLRVDGQKMQTECSPVPSLNDSLLTLNPKIADFGVAKRLQQEGPTLTNAVVGTVCYMAPEQARGDSKLVGPAADIYALGAMLYEMLTGRPPFQGNSTVEMLIKVDREDPIPPSRLMRNLPRDLESICSKCLEKHPSKRYSTARALADDLGRWQRDEPVLARPIGHFERTWRWARRHPMVATIVIATILLSLGVGAVSAWAYLVTNSALAKETEARTATATQLGESLLDRGLVDCRAGYLRTGLLRLGQALTALPRDETSLADAVRWQLGAWRSAYHRPIAVLLHTEPVSSLSFSADGIRLVTGAGDIARVWDVPTKEKIVEVTLESVQDVAFSPSGGQFAVACGEGELHLIDSQTGQAIGHMQNHHAHLRSVAFSPDGSRLATGDNDGRIGLWDPATGALLKEWNHGGWVYSVEFDPTGTKLVSSGQDYTAKVWEVSTGKRLHEFPHSSFVFRAVFNGEKEVITGALNTSEIWSLGRRVMNPRFRHDASIWAVAASPDRMRILTGGDDNMARLWNWSTRREIAVFEHDSVVKDAAFTPDGRFAATASDDGMVRLWQIPSSGAEGLMELRHANSIRWFEFSPDGRYIATASDDRTARLWDLRAGRLAHVLQHAAPVRVAQFAQGGRTLLTSSGGGDKTTVWDVQTGRMKRVLDLGGPSRQPRVNAAGDLFAAVREDDTVTMHDIETGKVVACLSHKVGGDPGVFSPIDDRISTWSRGVLHIWDGRTGTSLARIDVPKSPEGLVWSLDGKFVAASWEPHFARVFDALSGGPLGPLLEHNALVRAVAFSPDGQLLATGSSDKTARLWNVATGKLLRTLPHRDAVLAVQFTRDGKLLITGESGGVEGRTQLWHVASGKPIGAPIKTDWGAEGMTISPDGHFMVAAGHGSSGWLVALPEPVLGEPATVKFWAEAATAQEIDAHGGIASLTPESLADRERQLQQLSGGRLTAQPPRPDLDGDEAAWHRRLADECEGVNIFAGAKFHLDRLIALQPDSGELCAERAAAYAELAQWDQAIADFQTALDKGLATAEVWHGLALANLANGDTAGYRETCQAMIDRVRPLLGNLNAESANSVAWTCCLADDSVSDPPFVVQLAVQAQAAQPGSYAILNTLGTALYRAGRWQDAIDRLHEGVRANGGESQPQDWVVLAMAHHRLGRADEAQQWLDKANQWIEKGGSTGSWTDRLEIRLLHSEAIEMFRSTHTTN